MADQKIFLEIKKFLPSFLIDFYHFLLAFLGALLYGFPSQKIKVIGVTGTNGKTTVTEMIFQILKEAGYKVALSNSIRFKVGEEEKTNNLRMTMPGRFFLQRFLRKAVNSGCQYAILEVTSEGIKQHRHRFIDFEIAVFTNLAPEHIEAHGGFENYRKSKGKLFQKTKAIHIINLDDENAKYFLQFEAKKKYGYTLQPKKQDFFGLEIVKARNFSFKKERIKFEVNGLEFNLCLLGKFNLSNSLAAISVALSQGISLEISKLALEKMKRIPGRMEEVISKPFKVIVDYAFTPNALEQVYQTIRSWKSGMEKQRLICVLGACGGGRDKWKRPVLGKIAADYCQEIIVTNEDPFDEDPKEIINQVAEGTRGRAKKILERREAIREALRLAQKGDIVVITGKGCESSICLAKGKKIPWDDRKVVREEFQKIQS